MSGLEPVSLPGLPASPPPLPADARPLTVGRIVHVYYRDRALCWEGPYAAVCSWIGDPGTGEQVATLRAFGGVHGSDQAFIRVPLCPGEAIGDTSTRWEWPPRA